MKFCTKCGNELKDGEKFCTKCGNMIGAANNSSKKKVPQRNKIILIVCIVVALCCGGVFAFEAATDGLLMGDSRVILKTLKNVKNAESYSFDFEWNCGIEGTRKGKTEELDIFIGVTGDVSEKDKSGYLDFELAADGENESGEVYYQNDSSGMNFFANIDDEWTKGRVDLSQLNGELENLTKDTDWKNYFENVSVEKTKIGGINAYEIAFDVKVGDWLKLIWKDTEVAELMEDSEWEVFLEKMTESAKSMPNCRLVMYVDRKHYLPINGNWDMKEFANMFIDTMLNIMSTEEEIDFTIEAKKCNAKIVFSDFDNDVVNIPQEAYNGVDLGTLN